MIKLDVGTVGFSVAIVALALCFVIPRERSTCSGALAKAGEARFWFFVLSCACYGTGLLAIIHRGMIPAGWAVLGGNFLVILAAVALHAAISTIVGRPLMPRLYGLLLAAYLLFQSYYLFVEDDINTRIAVIALVRVPLFAHLAYCLHRARQTRPSLGLALMEGVLLVWVFLLLHRAVFALLHLDHVVTFVSHTGFQSIYVAAPGLGYILLVLALYRIDTEAMLGDLTRSNRELLKHQHHLEEIVDERTHALSRAKDAAETANIAKSAFVSNMSHEMRTPLHQIAGLAELIKRDPLTEKQRERMNKLEGACGNLTRMVDAVLEFSRLEAGKFDFPEAPLDLDALVRDTAAAVESLALAKQLVLVIDVGPLPAGLRGDAEHIRTALLNYLMNAIRFTHQGQVSVRVRAVEENPADALVRFDVEDTGIGIAPEDQDRLFRLFEQVDNSSTRQYGGVGAGLALTRKIAQLMGGDAGCSSRLGEGSDFWFVVRLAKAPGQQTADHAE